MASCYRCGKRIKEGYSPRRRVRTGGFERRNYGKHAHLVQTHYGFRIVCRRCALRLDVQEMRKLTIGHIQVLIALIVLFLVLALVR